MTVRQPAVAGQFYPGRREDLELSVDTLLAHARPAAEATALPPPKALIVPHAGYMYSGLTAAFAYALLEPVRSQIRRVVLLGPAHYVAFSGVALSPAEAFMTPMGRVPLAQDLTSALLALPQVLESASAHAP
ncbi:MAG TPA: AmmeMemoRadiSam system protein B, partial [Propionibacteriaceae bacterium]|nr:AmmeMemoRadiSam system protein B [Propionibacteriaceae bacterium]